MSRRINVSIPLAIVLSQLFFSLHLRAEEITIFDMRKNLGMTDQEVTHRDFILSKGKDSGLRPGMILTVKRRLPFYDTFHNRSAGTLSVPVARIKVIHVDSEISVARLHSEFSREELPLLEDNFVMVGDTVDLSSATSENKLKSKASEKEAEAEKSEEVLKAETPKEVSVTKSVDFAAKSADNKATATPDPHQPPVSGPVVQ